MLKNKHWSHRYTKVAQQIFFDLSPKYVNSRYTTFLPDLLKMNIQLVHWNSANPLSFRTNFVMNKIFPIRLKKFPSISLVWWHIFKLEIILSKRCSINFSYNYTYSTFISKTKIHNISTLHISNSLCLLFSFLYGSRQLIKWLLQISWRLSRFVF